MSAQQQPHLVGREPADPDLAEDDDVELEGAELGAAILARAKEHYSVDSLRAIAIPELTRPGDREFVIYARPVTFKERDRCQRKATRRGALDEGEYAARLVILKALDSKGQRLWNETDLRHLVGGVDSQIWARVAKEILGDGFPEDFDEGGGTDVEGN